MEQTNAAKFEHESEVIAAVLRFLQDLAKKDELLLKELQAGEASGFDEDFDPEESKKMLHKVD